MTDLSILTRLNVQIIFADAQCTVAAPANGAIDVTSPLADGATVTYSCDPGFIVVGSETLNCGTATLSGTEPTCQAGMALNIFEYGIIGSKNFTSKSFKYCV